MSTTQPIRNPRQLQDFKLYYKERTPNMRNYMLCILGLNTALRISDLLQLQWGDVWDFEKGRCLAHISLIEHKTGKESIIAINRSIEEVLTEYKKSLGALTSETYLFPSRKGNNCPLSRSQAFRITKAAAQAVGMPNHVSCHSMRKTFGYYAWQQGVPPVLLMDIYNHSSFAVTRRYLGIEQDERDSVFLTVILCFLFPNAIMLPKHTFFHSSM